MTSHEPGPDPRTLPNAGDAPPPSDWAPTSLSDSGQASYAGKAGAPIDAAGRTPSQSAISAFAPRRTLWPVVAALAAILVAALVIYTGLSGATNPTPTASPSQGQSHTPTPSRDSRPGTPFADSTGSVSGIWRIVEYHWTSHGLQTLIEVTIDSGSIDATYYAISSDGTDVGKLNTSLKSPAIPISTLTEGQTVRGWATFGLKERGTSMVFLSTYNEPQISGIEIAG